MKFHGVATAIIGKNKNNVQVSCTAIALDREDKELSILEEYSFKQSTDLNNTTSVQKAFSCVTSTICGLVGLQLQAMQSEEMFPIMTTTGIDPRLDFNLEKDSSKIYNQILLADLKQSIPTPFLISSWHGLRSALKYVESSKGEFFSNKTTPKTTDINLTEDNPLDQRLRELKGTYQNNSDDFIELLKISIDVGAFLAKQASENFTYKEYIGQRRFLQMTPILSDYRERPDLQEKHPAWSFIDWHPLIKKACTESYRETLGIKHNVYIKSAAEDWSPYFVDVLRTQVADKIDIANGVLTPEDIEMESKSTKKRFIKGQRESLTMAIENYQAH